MNISDIQSLQILSAFIQRMKSPDFLISESQLLFKPLKSVFNLSLSFLGLIKLTKILLASLI